MKKSIATIFCFFALISTMFTAYGSEIVPFANNYNTVNAYFTISSSGRATASFDYQGKSGVTKSATIETKIQKKFGLIWITVSDGSWTDTTKATTYSNSHSVQLSSTGTYRAHVEFTISGTGGSDDEITRNVQRTYS